jgi:hypothetical protein
MRNSLTHQNNKKDPQYEKLISMIYHAKILTESVFLSELGFDDQLSYEIIQKRRKYFRLEF